MAPTPSYHSIFRDELKWLMRLFDAYLNHLSIQPSRIPVSRGLIKEYIESLILAFHLFGETGNAEILETILTLINTNYCNDRGKKVLERHVVEFVKRLLEDHIEATHDPQPIEIESAPVIFLSQILRTHKSERLEETSCSLP